MYNGVRCGWWFHLLRLARWWEWPVVRIDTPSSIYLIVLLLLIQSKRKRLQCSKHVVPYFETFSSSATWWCGETCAWHAWLTRSVRSYIKHGSFFDIDSDTHTRKTVRCWLCIRQNRMWMWYPTELIFDGHSVTEEPPATSISASLGCIKFSNTIFLDSGQND